MEKQSRYKMPYPWLSLVRVALNGMFVVAVCVVSIIECIAAYIMVPGQGQLTAEGVAGAVMITLLTVIIVGVSLLAASGVIGAERRRHQKTIEARRREWLSASESESRTLLRAADSEEQILLRPPAAPADDSDELLVRPAAEPDTPGREGMAQRAQSGGSEGTRR